MERGRRRGGGETKAHEATGMMRWLLTYADMLTLLFALFVVLYAISVVKVPELIKVSEAIQNALGVKGPKLTQEEVQEIIKKVEGSPNITPIVKEVDQQEKALQELQKSLDEFIEKQGLTKSVVVKKEKRGLVVLLQTDNVLFDLGQADLRTQTKQILQQFVKLVKLAKIENVIRIEGHTDNTPLAGGEFRDNWGLSVARAASVLRFLVDKGLNPRQLEAAGLGEYQPLVANTDDGNRQKNRRVELIILTQKEEKENVQEKLRRQE